MRVIVVGEGMVELSRAGDAWRAGHGGDTLNTAVHLARLGHGVAFATALGTDPFSRELRALLKTMNWRCDISSWSTASSTNIGFTG